MFKVPGAPEWKTDPPLIAFPLIDGPQDAQITRAQERLLQAVKAWRDSEENPAIDAEETAVATVRFLADESKAQRESFLSGFDNEEEKKLLRKAAKSLDRYISFVARATAEALATQKEGDRPDENE